MKNTCVMKTVLRKARQVIEKMCALSKAFVLKIQVRLPLTSPRCFQVNVVGCVRLDTCRSRSC